MKEDWKAAPDLNLIPEVTPAEEYEVYNQWGTYYYSEDMHNLGKYAGASSVAFDERADRQYMMTFTGCLLWGFLANYLTYFFLKDMGLAYVRAYYVGIVFFPIPLQLLSALARFRIKSAVAHFIAYNLLVLPLGLQLLFISEYASPSTGPQAVQTILLGLMIVAAGMYAVAFFKSDLYLFTGRTFAVTLSSACVAVVAMLLKSGIGFTLLWGSLIVVGSAVYFAFVINRTVTRPKSTESAITVAYDVYMKVIIVMLLIIRLFFRGETED